MTTLLCADREVEVFRPRPWIDEQGRLALLLAGDPAYDDPAAPAARSQQRRLIFAEQRWVVYGAP